MSNNIFLESFKDISSEFIDVYKRLIEKGVRVTIPKNYHKSVIGPKMNESEGLSFGTLVMIGRYTQRSTDFSTPDRQEMVGKIGMVIGSTWKYNVKKYIVLTLKQREGQDQDLLAPIEIFTKKSIKPITGREYSILLRRQDQANEPGQPVDIELDITKSHPYAHITKISKGRMDLNFYIEKIVPLLMNRGWLVQFSGIYSTREQVKSSNEVLFSFDADLFGRLSEGEYEVYDDGSMQNTRIGTREWAKFRDKIPILLLENKGLIYFEPATQSVLVLDRTEKFDLYSLTKGGRPKKYAKSAIKFELDDTSNQNINTFLNICTRLEDEFVNDVRYVMKFDKLNEWDNFFKETKDILGIKKRVISDSLIQYQIDNSGLFNFFKLSFLNSENKITTFDITGSDKKTSLPVNLFVQIFKRKKVGRVSTLNTKGDKIRLSSDIFDTFIDNDFINKMKPVFDLTSNPEHVSFILNKAGMLNIQKL